MESSEKDYGDVRLAARIVELRESRCMSMSAFAEAVGVSQPTQSRIERAKRMPDAMYLLRLREQFWVDINALLTGKEERTDVGYTLEDCEAAGVDYVDAASGDEIVRFALDKAKAARLRREKEEEERKRGITARDKREADLLAYWRASNDEGRGAIYATAKAMAKLGGTAAATAAAQPAAGGPRRRVTARGNHSIAAGRDVFVVRQK